MKTREGKFIESINGGLGARKEKTPMRVLFLGGLGFTAFYYGKFAFFAVQILLLLGGWVILGLMGLTCVFLANAIVSAIYWLKLRRRRY